MRFFGVLESLPQRYGLTTKIPIRAAAHILLLLVIGVTVVYPGTAAAQGLSSWWGSAAWWDWSDYRAIGGVRIILPRLASGHATNGTFSYNLTDSSLGVTSDPQPVAEVWGELYVDRLGLRLIGESYAFTGRPDNVNDQRIATLQVDLSRFGLDLDLIRYPFFKFGIDADWHFSPMQWYDRSLNLGIWTTNYLNPGYALDPRGFLYSSDQPNLYPSTLGIHGQVIPARIKGVPLIGSARFRFPITGGNMAQVTEWEIGGGLRPVIWEISWLSHSTFSFEIEAGFRSTYLNTDATIQDKKLVPIPDPPGFPNGTGVANQMHLKAHWQGAYFGIAAYF